MTLRQWWGHGLACAVLLAADQGVKAAVRAHLVLGQRATLIPRVFGLYHVENTGAAFSMFSNRQFVLQIISTVAIVCMLTIGLRWFSDHPLSRWALTLMTAGALGNWIDRLARGYVVDMFEFLFVQFAIFNVADACLTVGVCLLCVHLFCHAHPTRSR